jgi:hypothetical protein
MRIFQYLLVAILIGLMGTVTPSSAVTVDICKTQWCERSAAVNRTACSELPSNPSCLPFAEDQLRKC